MKSGRLLELRGCESGNSEAASGVSRARGARVWAAARLVLWGLGLCLSAVIFVPWLPSAPSGYVEHQLHWAAMFGWRFGQNVVFTYGPLGFLALPFYEPRTYPMFLAANLMGWVFFALLLKWFARTLLSGSPSPLWFFGVLILPCFAVLGEWGPLLFVPYFFILGLLLICFFGNQTGRKAALTKQMIVTVLAAFALCKGSFSVLIMAGIAAIAVDDIARRRVFPWCLVNLVGTLAICWFGTGQSLGAICPYVMGSGEIAAGYREAMSYWKAVPTSVTVLFFILSGCMILLFCVCAWDKLGARAVLPVSVVGLVLYSVFLHGFVRKGGGHTVSACVVLAALALFLTPWFWNQVRAFKTRWPRHLLSGIVIAAPVIGSILFGVCWATMGMVSYPALRARPQEAWRLLSGQGLANLEFGRETRLQEFREAYRLPHIEGKIDMPGGDPTVLLAQGFEFLPRPTLVSYAAYTPYLAKLNAAYLESPTGPAAVLLPWGSIDGRYPTISDNRSFLSMTTHFQLTGRYGDLLLFQRRPQPLQIELVPVSKTTGRLGCQVQVPHSNRPLWATMDVRPTFFGRLMAAVFVPAPLGLDTAGEQFAFRNRLLPTLARDGFLLSPYLAGLDAAGKYYGSAKTEVVESGRVDVFRIVETPHPLLPAARYYEDDIEISFFEVVVYD